MPRYVVFFLGLAALAPRTAVIVGVDRNAVHVLERARRER